VFLLHLPLFLVVFRTLRIYLNFLQAHFLTTNKHENLLQTHSFSFILLMKMLMKIPLPGFNPGRGIYYFFTFSFSRDHRVVNLSQPNIAA
jgi:hypothetical protein